jgi:hypothetical protein
MWVLLEQMALQEILEQTALMWVFQLEPQVNLELMVMLDNQDL